MKISQLNDPWAEEVEAEGGRRWRKDNFFFFFGGGGGIQPPTPRVVNPTSAGHLLSHDTGHIY